jgi:O-methyltransferase involved in polyketide biosynthesis
VTEERSNREPDNREPGSPEPSSPGPSSREPSNTALTAAAARAAHLLVDDAPFIFADTHAASLLGDRAPELLGYHREHGSHPVLSAARAQVICRSRYAEDRLAAAVATGVRQYVILGAGLDTFAYRSPLAAAVRVLEVDHPETQAWKRAALAAAGFRVPLGVVFVPADLAADTPDTDALGPDSPGPDSADPDAPGADWPDLGSLGPRLRAAGFAFGEPAVISWLGVLMYLDRESIRQTLAVLAHCAPGTELIADYMLPPEFRDEPGDQYVQLVGPAAAERGEPWLSFFTPTEMGGLLAQHGFDATTHVGQRDAVPAELWRRTDGLRPIDLSMIAWSRVAGA